MHTARWFLAMTWNRGEGRVIARQEPISRESREGIATKPALHTARWFLAMT